MLKIKLSLFVFISLTLTVIGQDRLPAFDMNERLGRGINMGNSFEAPTETEWGNPWQPSYFKIIADLGFNHVRLPVRWETTQRSLPSAPYTINSEFLDRIQRVVDSALKYNLHIIINMHHHDSLYEKPAEGKERFLSQWNQIATHFKDYPDKLLFEVLNEPHGNITPMLWNEYFADALKEIRKTNPTRVVLMGVADYGGLGAISQLDLPDDEYIILSPHYYNPFSFTHQGAEWVSGADQWLGTKWLDTEADRESVASEFEYALQFSQDHHIPIHVGEFGAYSKADMESRERWTTFLARWFEEKGLSWAYWEFSAGFGIYNPATRQLNSGLVDALLHNEMPEAKQLYGTPLYTSNFTSGQDGWSLAQQGGASGTISTSSGNLNISISNGGSESWHLQLIRNNIRLEKDKMYRISFTANAQSDRSISFYAGKASTPWNSYSSTSGVNINSTAKTYAFPFTMTSPTDASARLVFDLGKSTAGVSISKVTVEELSFTPPTPTAIDEEEHQANFAVYPNPVTSNLWIKSLALYHSGVLTDMKGNTLISFKLVSGVTAIQMDKVPVGMYILSLQGNRRNDKIKLIKE